MKRYFRVSTKNKRSNKNPVTGRNKTTDIRQIVQKSFDFSVMHNDKCNGGKQRRLKFVSYTNLMITAEQRKQIVDQIRLDLEHIGCEARIGWQVNTGFMQYDYLAIVY